jgi:hypothetical protein
MMIRTGRRIAARISRVGECRQLVGGLPPPATWRRQIPAAGKPLFQDAFDERGHRPIIVRCGLLESSFDLRFNPK